MDRLCPICFEDMDMLFYEDQNESTPTCFKLECGHAFHTKCIITCLQTSEHRCPNCHEGKNFKEEMTREGILMNLIKDLRKDERTKEALKEYHEADKELRETVKQLKEDTIEFAKQRKEELNYHEKHKYFIKAISNVKSVMREVANEKSPMHRGLFSPKNTYCLRNVRFEKLALGAYNSNFYRLRSKTIYVHL
jgi:hypothetical protein